MDQLPALLRRNTRMTFFFLSLGCFGWALRPDWKPFFGGFMLGLAGGYLVSLHLAWKISMIAARAAAGWQRRLGGFGFLSRAAVGVLAAFVSVRVLEFNLPATAAGLFILPLVTLLLGLLAIRRRNGDTPEIERGEKQ